MLQPWQLQWFHALGPAAVVSEEQFSVAVPPELIDGTLRNIPSARGIISSL